MSTNLQLSNWSVSIEQWIPLLASIQKGICLDLKLSKEISFVKHLNSHSILQGLLAINLDEIFLIEQLFIVSSNPCGSCSVLKYHLDLWVIDVFYIDVIETRVHSINGSSSIKFIFSSGGLNSCTKFLGFCFQNFEFYYALFQFLHFQISFIKVNYNFYLLRFRLNILNYNKKATILLNVILFAFKHTFDQKFIKLYF